MEESGKVTEPKNQGLLLPFEGLKAQEEHSQVFDFRHNLFGLMKNWIVPVEQSKFVQLLEDSLKVRVCSTDDVKNLKYTPRPRARDDDGYLTEIFTKMEDCMRDLIVDYDKMENFKESQPEILDQFCHDICPVIYESKIDPGQVTTLFRDLKETTIHLIQEGLGEGEDPEDEMFEENHSRGSNSDDEQLREEKMDKKTEDCKAFVTEFEAQTIKKVSDMHRDDKYGTNPQLRRPQKKALTSIYDKLGLKATPEDIIKSRKPIGLDMQMQDSDMHDESAKDKPQTEADPGLISEELGTPKLSGFNFTKPEGSEISSIKKDEDGNASNFTINFGTAQPPKPESPTEVKSPGTPVIVEAVDIEMTEENKNGSDHESSEQAEIPVPQAEGDKPKEEVKAKDLKQLI